MKKLIVKIEIKQYLTTMMNKQTLIATNMKQKYDASVLDYLKFLSIVNCQISYQSSILSRLDF